MGAGGAVCRLLRGLTKALQRRGLDVTIKAGGPDISPVQVIAGRNADVIVNWMLAALAAREAVVCPWSTSRKFSPVWYDADLQSRLPGVNSPSDFKGKTLGVWFGGDEYPFLNWMAKLGLKPDTDIKVLRQGFNVDPLLQNQAAWYLHDDLQRIPREIDAGIKERPDVLL